MSNPERWNRFAALPTDLRERLAHMPDLLSDRGVLLVYLFGSMTEQPEGAGGRAPGDVDLAVLAERPAHELRADVHTVLGTERVDLVDLRRASPLLRFHVIRDGELLYSRDDETLNRFELDTLHLYRDTAPLRRRHRDVLRERMNEWS